MGPKNSKESTNNFMKDYDVVKRNPADNVTFLQHKQTDDQLLLREFNFNDKKECEKTRDKLAELKNKLAGNKHVVALKDYLMHSEDQYCSTFYKIYALFEYPERTLDDEINERNVQKRKFSETELWSILASCILGLSHLQKNGIRHSALKSSSILLSQEGIIKISDPFAIGATPNYDTAINKRSTPHLYLSPEQATALQQEVVTPSINHYKSDIWTLGMIMLEAGLLEYQDDCYRDDWSRIQWETLQYNINRFGQAYSEEIKNMVEFMLSRDERVRPDWVDLGEHVMKGDQAKKSIIQDDRSSTPVTVDARDHRPSSGRPSLLLNNPNNVPLDPRASKDSFLTRPVDTRPPSDMMRPASDLRPPSFPNTTVVGNYPINRLPSPRTSPVRVFNPNYPTNHYPPVIPQMNSGQVLQANMAPSRISNIEYTRPSRNIFPPDTYHSATKVDENLIMVEDDDESENPGQNDLGPSRIGSNRPFNTSEYDYNSISPSYAQGQPRFSNTPNENQPAARTSSQWEKRSTAPNSHPQLRYVEETFKMGSRYQGYQLNGLRHGHGKFYYQDGGMYDGDWKSNKMEGYGKLYYQSGKLAYEGEWKNDQFCGKGTLYNEIPDILEVPYSYENFDDFDEYWTKYEGDFADDMKNGRGTLYLSNGEKFVGEFIADVVEGLGTFYCQNGRQVTGRWANNQKIS